MEKQLLRLELTPIDIEMISLWNPVASITLAAEWTERMTFLLEDAVATLVEQHPIIAGTIRKHAEEEFPYVEARVHNDFMAEISGPEDFTPPRDTTEAIAMLHSLEARFVEKTIGGFQHIVQTEGPLFRVILMKLPKRHMAYCVEVSHTIADACSHYKIIDFINCAINGRPLPELQWMATSETVMFPEEYSPEDREVFCKGPLSSALFERSAKYSPGTDDARVVDIRFVDSGAIAAMKQEHLASAQADGVAFISTNDLIMAGFAELTDEGAIVNMAANMRDRLPGVTNNTMGNFSRIVSFPASAAAASPAFVRSLNKSFVHFGSEGNPRLSSEGGPKEAVLACNYVAVSNWASMTRFIEPVGAHILGHCGLNGFASGSEGIDIAFILKVDSKGTLAVMSNHLAGKRGKEIQERVSNSKIFQHLFIEKHVTETGKLGDAVWVHRT